MKLRSSSSNGVAGVWWTWIPLLLLWLLCTSTAWASPIVVESSISTSSSSSLSSLPHHRRELFDPVNSNPSLPPLFFILLHSSLFFIFIYISIYLSLALSLKTLLLFFLSFSFFLLLLLVILYIYMYVLILIHITNPTKKNITTFRNNQKYPATPVQEVLIHSIRS